jgi:allantoinase
MIFDLLLRNGTVVASDGLFEGNVYVKEGKIAAITQWDIAWEARRTEDVSGKLVFPGAIDVHVHFNDPGYLWREDFEHGTLAAAVGGVTTVLDMPLQNEPALTSGAIFHAKHAAVRDKALVNYGFWGGLVDDVPEKMEELHDAGVVAFKIFIGPVSRDYRSLDMGAVREALRKAASLGALVGFHAEDFAIIKHEEARAEKEGRRGRLDYLRSRPRSAEIIAVENVIELVRETGARAHICHVSHPEAAERVRRARLEGLPLSAETCTHYLVFSEDDFLREGTLFKCAPPLRERDAVERLWEYVIDGTLQCVASDHSPCAPREKDEKDGAFAAWGGISGVQTTMQVLYENAVHRRHLGPELLARCLSEAPARIFGLYGRKGAVAVGFDADIAVVDPEREWEIGPDSLFYLNKISAFTGLRGRGRPVMTFVRGELVFRDDSRVSSSSHGRLEVIRQK